MPPTGISGFTQDINLLKEGKTRALLTEIVTLFNVNLTELERLYNAIVSSTVKPLLVAKPEDMPSVFKSKYPVFTFYATSFLSSFSLAKVYITFPENAEKVVSLLKKVVKVEKTLYELYTTALKEGGARADIPTDRVEYAVAQLFDHDLWVLEKVSELGLENFLKLLVERAYDEVSDMYGYMLALLYVVMSVNTALFELVSYRKESLEILIDWAEYYARELDAYIDTVNLLITDEYYEAVEEYLREKGEDAGL